jgi:hypothetical protein
MSSSSEQDLLPYGEYHPYPPFIPPTAKRLLIGSFPPIILTRTRESDSADLVTEIFNNYLIKNPRTSADMDFYYGSKTNLFWRLYGEIYNCELYSLLRIKALLEMTQTAVTDVIDIAVRKIYDLKKRRYILPPSLKRGKKASGYSVTSGDNCLLPLKYRNIPAVLRDNKSIVTLIFTSSYSRKLFGKAFPEYSFSVRKGKTILINGKRSWQVYLLPSPSGAANKSIGRNPEFRKRKEQNPDYNTRRFRLDVYREVLLS